MIDTASPADGGRLPVRLWDLLLPLLLGFAAFAVIVAASALAVIVSARTGGSPTEVRDFVADLPKNFMAGQIFMAGLYGLLLFGIWLVARRHGPATLSGYFARVPFGTLLLAAAGGVLFAGIVAGSVSFLDSHKLVTFHETDSEKTLLDVHTPGQLAMALGVIALLAPFVEELYFRGLLLAWLRRRLWLPLAAIGDAVLFGLVHGRFVNHAGIEGWVLTAIVSTVGLINVGWYLRTRSLWPPAVMHAFYNGSLVMLAYYGQ